MLESWASSVWIGACSELWASLQEKPGGPGKEERCVHGTLSPCRCWCGAVAVFSAFRTYEAERTGRVGEGDGRCWGISTVDVSREPVPTCLWVLGEYDTVWLG